MDDAPMSHLLGCVGGKYVPLAHQPDAQAMHKQCTSST
jgi:hypothetical protein